MLNREQYLLTKAAEECSEISQILMSALKTQQFGMRENKPEEPTNKERVHAEINDLMALIDMLNEECNLNYNRHDPWNAEQIAKKKERVNHWYNYSVPIGRVEKPEEPVVAVALTGGGDPSDPSYKELREDGQQKEYLVLAEEEIKKGFVRPVRSTYIHTGERPKYPLRDLTDEEQERYKFEGYTKYETYPESESPACGRYWSFKQLQSGCGHSTTMGKKLSETYARDPKFYGATYCSNCGTHFPVREFTWEGTDEKVGS